MRSTAVKSDAGRELLVLGIVRRRPLSAYSIDRAVRNHSPLYRPFRQGNVYHLVRRLSEVGHLTKSAAKTKRGPSESKSVFGLSPAGERRFHHLLHDVLHDPQSSDAALEIALVLLGQLPRTEAAEMLRTRDKELAAQERRIKRLFGDMESRSAAAYLAGSHAVARVQSERRYLRARLRQLENPRWHPAWVLDDGPVNDPERRL
jgi:DNA-binding PadR family transcriptional regulator